MSTLRRSHAAWAVTAVVALVASVSGVAVAGGEAPAPASCDQGATSTVCTVPHVTETATVTATATTTVTVIATPTSTPTATSTPTTTPSPSATPTPAPGRTLALGMSAPANLWDQRLREVGPTGVTARRIFADFTSTGRDQARLIEDAVAAGMLPVVSYKGTPTTANVAAVRAYLTSLGVRVLATWHHEPHGDMTPAEFRTGSTAFLAVESGEVEVGPILNGWLLDRRRADFESYTSPALLNAWDFLGVDTYQSNAQSTVYPGHRIAPLLDVLDDAGHPDMPIVIGEYNGWTAAAIAESGRIFLDTPNVIVACVWNSGPTGLGIPLEGDRLAAFKATKADPRVTE